MAQSKSLKDKFIIALVCGLLIAVLFLLIWMASSGFKHEPSGVAIIGIILIWTILMIVAVSWLSIRLAGGIARWQEQHFQELREKGLWPPPDVVPTDEHVKKLVQADLKLDATLLYQQIHSVSHSQAKAQVEQLARSAIKTPPPG
jgi:hypothetical protein